MNDSLPMVNDPSCPSAPPSSHECLLVVDFGSQFTQLIARRLRELNVFCEIIPSQLLTVDRLERVKPRALILSGGPASVMEPDSPKPHPSIYELGVPIMGICYGQQVMTAQLGGQVEQSSQREFGRAYVRPTREEGYSQFLTGLFSSDVEEVWMSHGDRVNLPAHGFESLAVSDNAPNAVIADEFRHFYGLQFHPEVHHTPNGLIFIQNFLDIAGFSRDWSMAVFKDEATAMIRQKVGDGHVICGLSGGVDSSVTALLVHLALPGQVTCVFVDHGFMRKNEADEVVRMFRNHYNIPLIHAQESEMFLAEIAGISDPERKRHVIGEQFINVFRKYARRIAGANFLAQGTLYPDVIESVSFTGSSSATIKSHHNVGGLPADLNFQLVEPLRELFKDEVRLLGQELGLPGEFVARHPFPGPGLAIRCIGEVTTERLDLLRLADSVFIEQIRKHGLYDEIWQAFAVLLPVKTVGVMGDDRTYENVCALRAVTSVDGMTADFYPFTAEFLSETSNRIINEIRGINRVTYDTTSKPPGTIEWE